MSEAEVTKTNGADSQAVDKNAQANSEVDNMLAQLQAKKAATTESSEKKDGSIDTPVKSNEGDKDAEKEVARKKNEHNSYQTERKRRETSRERSDRRGGNNSYRGGRGGSRGGNFQKKNNNRFDPSTQEQSDDPVAIRKQVEFYFSDSNLPLDKFLLTQVGGAANNPVDLETICSFKRMRHFQPRSAIVTALKESDFLDLVDEDTKVKRKVPLSEELADANNETVVKVVEDRAMPRSIYVKGFGEEYPSTQFDIEAFFAPFGPTNAIRLRRKDHDKTFKGSVFVEFDTEETMKAFLALDPTPEYKGKKLQIMTKKEYCDGKAADIAAGKIRANSPRGGGHKRGRDDRDWRDRRDEDRRRGNKRGGGHGFGSKRGRDSHHGERNRERDARGEKDASTGIDKDTESADAVARARAIVEAEKAKEQQQTTTTDEKAANGDNVAAGQKRPREAGDEATEQAEGEREAKKVDVKDS